MYDPTRGTHLGPAEFPVQSSQTVPVAQEEDPEGVLVAADVTLEQLSVGKASKATVGHGRASGLQLVPRTTTLKT